MKLPFFNREFFDSLPEENDDAIVALADEYARLFNAGGSESGFDHDFLEAYAILQAFFEARALEVTLPQVTPPTVNRSELLNVLRVEKTEAKKRIYQRESTFHFESKTEEYRARFAKAPVYELSDKDHNRIHELIKELRELIQIAVLIPQQHKGRLQKRLEAMQKELHKRTSDIDRFWGFVAEAAIVSRKFGDDLKPINERVEELGQIVVAIIFAKEGIQALPNIVKLLQVQ